jgi:hypothetical protein
VIEHPIATLPPGSESWADLIRREREERSQHLADVTSGKVS